MSAPATPLGATHAIGRPDSAVEQVRAGRGGGSFRGGGAYRGGAAYRGGVAYRGGAGPPIAAGSPTAAGPGPGLAGTGGGRAARSRPVQPSASSRRRQRPHGPVLPRQPTCAGTTPIRARRRAPGTTACDGCRRSRAAHRAGPATDTTARSQACTSSIAARCSVAMSRVATSKLSSSAVKRNDWVNSVYEPVSSRSSARQLRVWRGSAARRLPKCGARASHQVGLSRYRVVTARRIPQSTF